METEPFVELYYSGSVHTLIHRTVFKLRDFHMPLNELSPPSSVGVLETRCDRMDDHTSLVVVEPKRRLNVKASSAMFFRHALYLCPSTASIATWDELVSRLARDSC